MKYIVYLTTNMKSQINGINRIYIGIHKTNNPSEFDGYLGDGVYTSKASTFMYPKSPFQCAIKKYGVQSFRREVLYIFDTLKEAQEKENEIVDSSFMLQSHTYNMYIDHRVLYQFDLNGNLVKEWKDPQDAIDFYSIPASKFRKVIDNKEVLVRSFWSYTDTIDVQDYSCKLSSSVYLCNLDGKLLKEFSYKEAMHVTDNLKDAILNQKLVDNKFYLTNKLLDVFMVKPRRSLLRQRFYVYREGKLSGEYVGKEIMNAIELHSWKKISNIFTKNNNWYKDFYITLEPTDNVPLKRKSIVVDVYDKYGKFIESIDSLSEVKNKYNIPASKLKGIQLGNKYFGDLIFKYSTKNNK